MTARRTNRRAAAGKPAAAADEPAAGIEPAAEAKPAAANKPAAAADEPAAAADEPTAETKPAAANKPAKRRLAMPPKPARGPEPAPAIAAAAAATAAARPDRAPERVVTFRPKTILTVVGVVLGVLIVIGFFVLARAGLTLIAVALFLALALNPAVEFFQRRGLGRGLAVATVYVLVVVCFVLLAAVFIPPLVAQITHFVQALPGLVEDLTKGRGPFGFLERKYHVVEQVTKLTKQSSGELPGVALPALGVAEGVATTIGGIFIIGFLTLFMLLEGPEWRTRVCDLIPDRHRPSSERIGAGIYKSVGGFVTGNLLASFIAGLVATMILLIAGVPYAFPLGLFTAIIELIPYIGPAVVTLLLSLVALTVSSVAAGVVFGVMLVYHLIEGHTLRPLIYGRALNLSALAVLVAIILGTEVAGILGALAAIPVAGSIQVILSELIDQRMERESAASAATADAGTGPG